MDTPLKRPLHIRAHNAALRSLKRFRKPGEANDESDRPIRKTRLTKLPCRHDSIGRNLRFCRGCGAGLPWLNEPTTPPNDLDNQRDHPNPRERPSRE